MAISVTEGRESMAPNLDDAATRLLIPLENTMCRKYLTACALALLVVIGAARGDPPVASYIFPAGGQRGKLVRVRVGGLNLHQQCHFEMLGAGVRASEQIRRTRTIWFEGPLLPLPDSQQQEDYPKDMTGRVQLAADAPLGIRHWRLWNGQGATPAMKFVVGDLPEIVEQEIEGDPVPALVRLPVTINGRIFPRENVDIWSFVVRKGQTVCCEVNAARLGSPLDSRLEVRDPAGQVIAENDDTFGADSFVRFTAAVDGTYQVRIHDINYRGGQAYVYRLTLTADPHVDRVYPLGGRRGSKVKFEVTGQGLPKEPVEIVLPEAGGSPLAQRLNLGGRLTNHFLLDLDDLPEYLETEPNDRPEQVKPVALPAVLNGRIGKAGDVDYWAVTARKGESYEVDLRAARLGSPLRGVLTISDPAGKEFARADGNGGQNDPVLTFTAPADGAYRVRVEEFFASRGGPEFGYRLRIDRRGARPDFHLLLGRDTVVLNRGTQVSLPVTVERQGGFNQAVVLQVDGLPKGVTVQGTTVAANQGAANLTFKAEATAPIRGARLAIRGMAKFGDKPVVRTAALPGAWGVPPVDAVLLAVTLPTPFQIKGHYDMSWAARGTVHERRYRIERGGFKGPIQVMLADRQARHLQGVTGPTITVPAGVSEFTYGVYLPPWMETGRTSRTCVMAVAVVKDADDSEHTVSHSSVQTPEQVVVVVEPGRLELAVERSSLAVEPGKTITVPVRIARGKTLKGAAKIELVVAEHLHGIRGEMVTIPADKSEGALAIRFAADVQSPMNVPVVVRATVVENGKPVVGEARLELLTAKGR
jgi:hypothetical protein